jgi:hypothetical protein
MPKRLERPLAIDLFCGLGGWTEGLLAEGYRVVGFDTEQHVYADSRYPAQLVLQDVRTLDGAQFKDAALIVASPPCQAYSYRAMPWKRAKALPPPDNALFDACFRIQREASAAAGRHIPLVVENVNGAQPWVGRAKWHHGSYYLWGDVPALMPVVSNRRMKFPAHCGPKLWRDRVYDGDPSAFHQEAGLKQTGISGQRTNGRGSNWFQDGAAKHGSKSHARKAASARLAKIPLLLAQHIARAWKP